MDKNKVMKFFWPDRPAGKMGIIFSAALLVGLLYRAFVG